MSGETKKKRVEKKKSTDKEAGNKKNQPVKKKRSGAVAPEKNKKSSPTGNKTKQSAKKRSTGVSVIMKDKLLRGPEYKVTVLRVKTVLVLSVTAAKVQEKMTHSSASVKLVFFTVIHGPFHPFRRAAALEAANYKKAAATERRVQKVFAAQGRAAAVLAKATQSRAAKLNQAVY